MRAQAHFGDIAACFGASRRPQELGRRPRRRGAVRRWGGAYLAPEKAERVVEEARCSVGVRVGEWQRRQIQEYAREVSSRGTRSRWRNGGLRELAVGNKVLEAQGKLVGIPTACVLWTCTGDPRNYHAAAAYRKAMGLNLKDLNLKDAAVVLTRGKSALASGECRRGSGSFFAALQDWCNIVGCVLGNEAKKARNQDDARKVVVAVMRKLAMVLYHIGVKGEEFQAAAIIGAISRRGVGGKSKT